MGLDLNQLRQDMCVIQDSSDRPNSFLNWGKLVKSWATGVDQFGDNKDRSIPATDEAVPVVGSMTKDEFQSKLRDANVMMTIPDSVTRFVFVQDDDSTVIVRVPRKRVVEKVAQVINELPATAPVAEFDPPVARYPLPQFYLDNWRSADVLAYPSNGLLELHCLRVGEYTINTCA
jgi:hypothetical protein